MSSKRGDLADALVDLLNDEENEFVLQFEAAKRSAPLTAIELRKADGVQVFVFTGSSKSERVERKRFSKTYKPVISIQRALKEATAESAEAVVEQLNELVEQIEEKIEGTSSLAGLSLESLDDDQDREAYNVEALADMNFYATTIQPEYTSG